MSTDKKMAVTDEPEIPLAGLRGRIRSRLAELRISAREASRRAGLNVGYVGDLLEGRSKAPEIDRIMKLAEALELPFDELVSGISIESSNSDSPIRQDLESQTRPQQEGMVPLYAARIAMNEPFSKVSDTPIGMVPALPALHHVRGAYAVTVFNNMNEPRYFPGEVIYMSPEAEPQTGDFIFGRLKSGLAAIGRLVKIENGKITWEFIAAAVAAERLLTVDLTDVEFFHRIVGSVG
jgi:transcriptional regulator with XRE-family HTH domain